MHVGNLIGEKNVHNTQKYKNDHSNRGTEEISKRESSWDVVGEINHYIGPVSLITLIKIWNSVKIIIAI